MRCRAGGGFGVPVQQARAAKGGCATGSWQALCAGPRLTRLPVAGPLQINVESVDDGVEGDSKPSITMFTVVMYMLVIAVLYGFAKVCVPCGEPCCVAVCVSVSLTNVGDF